MSSSLRSFEFSVDTSFIIEVGWESGTGGFVRFLKIPDHAYILSGSDPYAIASPYEEADLFQIQFKQINDVVFITHPDYAPRKLSRLTDDEWTLEEIVFDVPALLDENVDDTFTITPSGTTGSITLTASDDLFASGQIGGYFRIGHLRDADTVELAISGNNTSSTLSIKGDWNVRSYGTWTADLLIERSTDGGTTWTLIRRLISKDSRNVDVEGVEDEDNLLRLRVENYVSNTDGRALLESTEAVIRGTVEITAVATTTSATATVLEDLYSTDATVFWSEGAWSEYRGYPRAVAFHEGRIWYGGTAHQPLHVWGSVTDDFENFERGTADDASVVFQLASSEFNAVQWLASKTDLLVGLAGAEWRVRGDRNGNIITPSRIDAKEQSKYGSEYIQPITIGGQVIFVERRGRTLREMAYSYEVERYVSDTNLNLLAEHRGEAGIKQMAFQRVPIPTIWCVMNDGTLSAFTYDRAQNVVGWHKHTTDGSFLSVATTYGSDDTEDEVYFIVERTVGSSTVQFIERLDSNRWTAKEDAFFVDCGLTYDGSAVSSVTGMDHLAGEDVVGLADGVPFEATVGLDGSVDLPSSIGTASVIHVGLPFTSVLSPFRFDADSKLGVHSGHKKKVTSVVLRLYRALGMTVEIEGQNVEVKRPEGDQDTDPLALPLFGQDRPEDVSVSGFSQGFRYDPSVVITQTDPLPVTVSGMNVSYDVSSGV